MAGPARTLSSNPIVLLRWPNFVRVSVRVRVRVRVRVSK
jgi:hypothetical protein